MTDHAPSNPVAEASAQITGWTEVTYNMSPSKRGLRKPKERPKNAQEEATCEHDGEQARREPHASAGSVKGVTPTMEGWFERGTHYEPVEFELPLTEPSEEVPRSTTRTISSSMSTARGAAPRRAPSSETRASEAGSPA